MDAVAIVPPAKAEAVAAAAHKMQEKDKGLRKNSWVTSSRTAAEAGT